MPAVLGPAITAATSGNLVKATEAINGWSAIDSKTEWQWNASNHVRQDKGSFPKKGSDFIIFEKPL